MKRRLLIGLLFLGWRLRILALLLALPGPAWAVDWIRYYPPSGGGGVGLADTNVWTGDNRFTDSLFFLRDNGDLTKLAQFQLSGITTATTRTLTVPNADGTLPLINLAQSWSAAQSFTATMDTTADITLNGPGNNAIFFGPLSFAHLNISTRTGNTPDTGVLGTGTTSNAVLIAEGQDQAFDFSHAAQTNPTLFGHSAAQSTTQWWGLTHNATNGVLSTGLGALVVASASGIIISTGSAPTISACGTTPSAAVGSNTAGRLTTGSGGTVQSCTLTFVPALVTAPSCVCNNETNILTMRSVATTTTLVCDAAVAGTMESDVITYLCIGGL